MIGNHALEDFLIAPVVRDSTDEIHVGVHDGAHTWDLERTLGGEKVLCVVRDAFRVEDVRVRGSPGLSR